MLATSRSLILLALAPMAAQCVAQPAPPPLPTRIIEPASPVRYQVWDGVVEATRETTIAAQTNGKVIELPFDVGDSFTHGAVLARLSDVEQQAGLRSAQARLTAAQAESREAGIHWKRTAELFQQHANSQAQLDAATTRRDTSRANLDATQAAVHSAEQQVSYTVIQAPFDGVILHRFVRAGQAVQSGPPEPQPILSIAALDSLRVDAVVPQTTAAAIRAAKQATVRLDGNREITGVRITVFPYADAVSHTIHVRVDLPGKIENLYPGMTVPVAFPMPGPPRLLIPTGDIISRGELAAVYVLGPDDALSLRQVRLGRESGGLIEVLAGLRAGERIVTDTTAAAQYMARQHAAGGSHP